MVNRASTDIADINASRHIFSIHWEFIDELFRGSKQSATIGVWI